MSITDELREWAHGFNGPWKRNEEMLLAIADRIDEEHERAMAAAALIVGVPITDENMAEHGWIRLPLDADGVPICVGDVMDSKVDYLFDGKPFTVRALVLCEDGWEVGEGRFGNRYEPDSLHHHHEPTVEDVLLEACNAYHSLLIEGMSDVAHDMPAPSEIIAEYSAKLRLANDGEEQ